ncbi:MAG: hypothetical protein JWP97_4279 [Labilithrix sp.]|nr:hypothetical protein [Labilithrix sp.]
MPPRTRPHRWAPGLLALAVTACGSPARARGTSVPSGTHASGGLPRLPSGEPDGANEGDTGELPALPPPDESVVPMTAAMASGAPPAARYASLTQAQCEAELGKRSIAFERVAEAKGVVAPLRLKSTVGGIDFHSMLPPAQRKTSPYEIYDCRLVLAIDDWARVLVKHDVVEVIHYSVYRPPPAKATLGGPGRRHPGGLAIDAAIFKLRDGTSLSVEKDFHGRIGGKPCAPVTGLPATSTKLRALVCEAAEQQLFNVLLTPDFNWAHRNHFHLEVSASARWVYLR